LRSNEGGKLLSALNFSYLLLDGLLPRPLPDGLPVLLGPFFGVLPLAIFGSFICWVEIQLTLAL